ncbi:MAG: MarR family transcriptional regulator [Lachnospiraceae bacterium]|nr:MarR family transcriptional regulator [Lachnospiraceae bacterium]
MSKKHLHVLLIRTFAAHKKKSRQRFQDLGLTEGQPKVLSILCGMEGCLQKELAEACRVEPATMTSLLKNMEQKGLIYKEKLQVAGKRAYAIYLTESGKVQANKVLKIVEELEEVSFKGFTSEEKKQFLELFERVKDNLAD